MKMRRRRVPLNRVGRRRETKHLKRRTSEQGPEKRSGRNMLWLSVAALVVAVVVLIARVFRLFHP